jgi:hypothetical protein
MNAMGTGVIATCILILITACSASPSLNSRPGAITIGPNLGPAVILTDQALAEYASRKASLGDTDTRRVLGVHNGIQVIEQLFCGNLCPLNTIRVIYYDLPKARRCDEAGGKHAEVRLPKIASPYMSFYVPSVLSSSQDGGEALIVR